MYKSQWGPVRSKSRLLSQDFFGDLRIGNDDEVLPKEFDLIQWT